MRKVHFAHDVEVFRFGVDNFVSPKKCISLISYHLILMCLKGNEDFAVNIANDGC